MGRAYETLWAVTLTSIMAGCGMNRAETTEVNADARAAPVARYGIDRTASLPLCPQPAGTMGLPELPFALPLPDSAPLMSALSAAPLASLPAQVTLRGRHESFNRRYWFALHEGRVWYKKNPDSGSEGPWTAVPMPDCLIGTLVAISADDDELIALRRNGDIYGLDNILKDPALFNWTSRWGPPVWTGSGYHVPEDFIAWSWSVISPQEDVNWTDPSGNHQAVGQGKVSHIWLLRDGGQRFTYLDPWLPNDEAYEMCGPERGRFRAINLTASGSTILAIGAQGELYTRHYDFDLSGADNVFFRYSYEDQRGVANPAIQLPVFDWVAQPRIPGAITDAISLHKFGQNMEHRVMRVAGWNATGTGGYWQKEVEPVNTAWMFVAVAGPVPGRRLDNTATAPMNLGSNEDQYYARNLAAVAAMNAGAPLNGDADWAGELLDFNVYCSPAVLRIHTAPNESMDLTLHSTDVIRQTPRARGLDDNPRGFNADIEIPAALFAQLDRLTPRQQQFIQRYLKNQRHTTVSLSGIRGRITFSDFNWTFDAP